MNCVLTIAASDPSGGAGIQATLRVIHSQRQAGISVITALTAQNSHGVNALFPTPPDALSAQLETILSDSTPAAVQIGLLPNADAVSVVAGAIRRYRLPAVVLDPVLVSSSGFPFLDAEGQTRMIDELLPLCLLVTPNLPEAERLLGGIIRNEEDRRSAAQALVRRGTLAALIKGGHLEGDAVDLLLDENGQFHTFSTARIATPHDHGTGCFLSAAIAARLAAGDPLPTAVGAAKSMLTAGLRRSIVVGGGRGYPGDPWGTLDIHSRTHSQRLKRFTGLYVLTDPLLQGSLSAEEVANLAWDSGASVVQLRDKRLNTPDLLALSRSLATMARQRERLFIVNDRVDVAVAAEADGVHIGPDDMPAEDARQLLGHDRLLGVSVGTVAEALAAAPFASYLAVGAIYGSSTKDDAGAPVGPDRIRAIRAAVPGIPICAIGGIGAGNIQPVIDAGAVSVAVISAVLCAPDPAEAVRELSALMAAGVRG